MDVDITHRLIAGTRGDRSTDRASCVAHIHDPPFVHTCRRGADRDMWGVVSLQPYISCAIGARVVGGRAPTYSARVLCFLSILTRSTDRARTSGLQCNSTQHVPEMHVQIDRCTVQICVARRLIETTETLVRGATGNIPIWPRDPGRPSDRHCT